MPYDAFISYSSLDKATADATCAALEASGIRCWIAPRDIVPGAEWGEAIVLAINQSRLMILIFSANANESPQIRREVERAVSKGIPIIPVRIEDIPPAHSLEYFIGTVHWLDAMTPPLEAHLRRLTETVRTLLHIDSPPSQIVPPVPPTPKSNWRMLAVLAVAGVVIAGAAGVGLWRYLAPAPPAVSVSPPAPVAPSVATAPSPSPSVAVAPPAAAPPPAPAPVSTQARIDPAMVGTFTHDALVDDYDSHFVYSIAADGTYTLVTTAEERGTYQAARGQYRTVSTSGRVRAGSYRAVGPSAIEIKNPIVTAIFQPAQPIAPLDQRNPVMLGVWHATAVIAGVSWAMTIENHPDGTYRYQAVAQDHGACAIANQQWRTTSLVTGQSNTGSYRLVDGATMETTAPDGVVRWRRQ